MARRQQRIGLHAKPKVSKRGVPEGTVARTRIGGLRCPECHYPDSQVIDSRMKNDFEAVRRRRTCLHCGYRWTTWETNEDSQKNPTFLRRELNALLHELDELITRYRTTFDVVIGSDTTS